MTNKPDEPVVEEGDSVVQEDAISDAPVAAPKAARKTARKPKAPAKKVASKRASKPKAPASKQRKTAAKPVAPPPPPLTLSELKEQGVQAKQELVSAVLEPALEAAGSLSQTIRDTIGGAFAGLLSRKRRDD
jgi:hypothetical protein